MASTVRFLWREPESHARFRTAVCLHGHTMHSEERLNFLPTHFHRVPGISQIVSYYEHPPRSVDFARAWWTPPLSPAAALRLEQDQIAALDLRPIVSLTDHDNIEAPLALGVTSASPISVEWTVPYERSIFHLGVHNLPRSVARDWMAVMALYTACPRESELPGMLSELSRLPGILTVLNHPYWLEEGIREEHHPPALACLLRECLPWLDAFELNGTRKWDENVRVVELSRVCDRPVISGGDRHACEPSACINLTNAGGFEEFADEIRGGRSEILFMPQYREPMAQRILGFGRDILAEYPEYPDRRRWSDRIYYRGGDGEVRNLTQIWGGNRGPGYLEAAVSAVQYLGGSGLRPALKLLLTQRGEQAL